MTTDYPTTAGLNDCLEWARSQRTGATARKSVLLAITEAICDPSITNQPSPALLARQTEQSEEKVRDHLCWLKGNRVIRWYVDEHGRDYYELVLSTHLMDATLSAHDRIELLLREAADLWVQVESPDLVTGTSTNRFLWAAESAWYDARDALPPTPPLLPPPPKTPNDGCYLYRLWQPDGRLLYVGVSTKLRSRLRSHERKWGDLWDHATWEEHPDPASMLAAEAEAIREENPALNRSGIK